MPNPKINTKYILTNEKCSYGCNSKSVFAFMNGKFCCSNSANKCEAIRTRNKESLRIAHKNGRFKNRIVDYAEISKKITATN